MQTEGKNSTEKCFSPANVLQLLDNYDCKNETGEYFCLNIQHLVDENQKSDAIQALLINSKAPNYYLA